MSRSHSESFDVSNSKKQNNVNPKKKDIDNDFLKKIQTKLDCIDEINIYSDTNLVSKNIDKLKASQDLNCSNINKCFTVLTLIILFSKVREL